MSTFASGIMEPEICYCGNSAAGNPIIEHIIAVGKILRLIPWQIFIFTTGSISL
jgi:hypothetical protein